MNKVQLSLLDCPIVASHNLQGCAFIPLTQGMFAIVDAADYEWLSRYKWRAFPNSRSGKSETYCVYYAVRSDGRKNIKMHRMILEHHGATLTPDIEIDHRNHNALDNRRSNLRLATRSQNQINRPPRSVAGYKGVSRAGARWRSRLHIGDRQIHLGMFDTPEQAAIAYNHAVIEQFGEFAYLNPVGEFANAG